MPLLEPEPTENGPASQHCKMLLGFDVTSWLTSKEMLPPLCHTFSRVVEPVWISNFYSRGCGGDVYSLGAKYICCLYC